MKPEAKMIAVAATQNEHKIREIESITKQFGITIITRAEAGVPDVEIEEDGDTFEANSEIKAREVMRLSRQISVADDSGLVVDALGGLPGVISARFAGEEADDIKNNEKLLRMMEGVPDGQRTARFVSVITMVFPDGYTIVARGECEGHILRAPRGSGGFGYDPLFVPNGWDRSFGELSPEEKNQISHRAMALRKLKEILADGWPEFKD